MQMRKEIQEKIALISVHLRESASYTPLLQQSHPWLQGSSLRRVSKETTAIAKAAGANGSAIRGRGQEP